MFTRRDLISSVISGLTAGMIGWRVLVFLEVGLPFGFSPALLVFIIPVLWIFGVNLGYFLGKWIGFFNQFGKFAAIGFTNFAVDTGVLNLLIAFSGIASGIWFTVFKSVSFSVAVLHSYAWNKFWVFNAGESGRGRSEFLKFISINFVAIILNVGVASLVVNYIEPFGGMGDKAWANIGAIVGSALGLIFAFVGSKLIVFKKNDEASKQISM